jgi:hypothetical protein
MSAVAFDSLEYAHQLEAAGMPRAQAEVVAKGLTSMFIHNFEALVTKDYLDARFAASDAKMDTLFARVQVIAGAILVAVAIPLLQSFWGLLS